MKDILVPNILFSMSKYPLVKHHFLIEVEQAPWFRNLYQWGYWAAMKVQYIGFDEIELLRVKFLNTKWSVSILLMYFANEIKKMKNCCEGIGDGLYLWGWGFFSSPHSSPPLQSYQSLHLEEIHCVTEREMAHATGVCDLQFAICDNCM